MAQLDLLLYRDQPGIDLDSLITDLSRAVSVFNLASSRERQASAQTALALAYALNSNTQDAHYLLEFALLQIRRHDLRKQLLEALYHRALIGFLQETYDAALGDIDQALALGKRQGIGEFEVRLRLLKGQAYEEAGEPEAAMAANEDTFNAAKESPYGRDRLLIEAVAEGTFRVRRKIPSACGTYAERRFRTDWKEVQKSAFPARNRGL